MAAAAIDHGGTVGVGGGRRRSTLRNLDCTASMSTEDSTIPGGGGGGGEGGDSCGSGPGSRGGGSAGPSAYRHRPRHSFSGRYMMHLRARRESAPAEQSIARLPRARHRPPPRREPSLEEGDDDGNQFGAEDEDLPYPDFVPYALYCMRQSNPIRNLCLRCVCWPYPFWVPMQVT